MKKLITTLLIVTFIILPLSFLSAKPAQASVIPFFIITHVAKDQSVSIQTYNFPANDSFDVLMGPIGTKGVNGIKVAVTNSGKGGSFSATYTIPKELKGSHQIAIRLQSNMGSGYYAYNWFYNITDATPPPNYYIYYPVLAIVSVKTDKNVTFQAYNLNHNDKFDVLMGPIGTQAINGIKVGSFETGSADMKTLTYQIPNQLKGAYQIAIRIQSPISGFYAYNWFYNKTGSIPPVVPVPPPGYVGYPVFSISSVVRDKSVTIQAYNLPPNDTFTVLMGPMGTKGINGIKVTSIDTGKGGSQKFTFTVPSALKGSYQISIRLQSAKSGYFAYNWFYNVTFP